VLWWTLKKVSSHQAMWEEKYLRPHIFILHTYYVNLTPLFACLTTTSDVRDM